MKYRGKLGYIVLGGGLMLVGMLAANLTPLTATRDTFDRIYCTDLTVLSPDGETAAVIFSNGDYGQMVLYGPTGSHVVIGATEDGGLVGTKNNSHDLQADLMSVGDSAEIRLLGRNVEAALSVNRDGSSVIVTNIEGQQQQISLKDLMSFHGEN